VDIGAGDADLHAMHGTVVLGRHESQQVLLVQFIGDACEGRAQILRLGEFEVSPATRVRQHTQAGVRPGRSASDV
jgi:hypothetical protein